MSWSEDMIDRLAALKLTGLSFDACWAIALSENPPAGSEFRGMSLTLLRDPAERDPVEFLRWAADDAWHGRRPALAHLQTALDHHIAVGLDLERPLVPQRFRRVYFA